MIGSFGRDAQIEATVPSALGDARTDQIKAATDAMSGPVGLTLGGALGAAVGHVLATRAGASKYQMETDMYTGALTGIVAGGAAGIGAALGARAQRKSIATAKVDGK
jgi:hypothetical protein